MINLAVIFGGKSDEYEISLHSAYSIIKALDPQKYNLTLIGIKLDGSMYQYAGDIEHIPTNAWTSEPLIPLTFSFNTLAGIYLLENNTYLFKPIDVVFPILHGKNGEDGTISGLLQLANLKYVGCDFYSSALGMDKAIAHTLVSAQQINVPTSTTLYKHSFKNKDIENLVLEYPLFVKPTRSGSSIGISKVNDEHSLLQAIHIAFEYDDKIILEKGIIGNEVGVGIIGYDDLLVSEVDCIELKTAFFDYEDKYINHQAQIQLPAPFDADLKAQIKGIAKKIYRILNCQGLCRIDMFIDSQKQIYFNEVNTMPGFTSTSRFPNMFKACGYSYSSLLDIIIKSAYEH